MFIQKRWSFGLGTMFSLIVVYFIFLYSRDKGWTLLAILSKWYLIIIGGFILLLVGIIIIVILFSLLLLLFSLLKIRKFNKKRKSKIHKGYIDAEYKLKE